MEKQKPKHFIRLSKPLSTTEMFFYSEAHIYQIKKYQKTVQRLKKTETAPTARRFSTLKIQPYKRFFFFSPPSRMGIENDVSAMFFSLNFLI